MITVRGPISPSEMGYIRTRGSGPTRRLQTDNDVHAEAARSGVWIAFDGCRSEKSAEKHLSHLLAMKERGLLDRVHLSHDAGWYRPGEPNGGKYTPYRYIFMSFLDQLRSAGSRKRKSSRSPSRTWPIVWKFEYEKPKCLSSWHSSGPGSILTFDRM